MYKLSAMERTFLLKIKFLIFGIYATCFSFGALGDDCGPASMLVNGFCTCVPGAVLNDVGVCECKPGSELNSNNECACKGHFSRPAGSDECMCDPGYYLIPNGGYYCVECEIGKYKDNIDNSVDSCRTCPVHQTTLNKGETSADACLCKKGYYWHEENDGGVCLTCPVATYKDHVGNDTACEPCSFLTDTQGTLLATYSNEGASECSLCPKGSCCFDGLKYDCNIGTYSSNLGTFCATANPVASQPQCEDKGINSGDNNGGGGGGGQCIPGLATEYIPGACTPCPAGCSTQHKNSVGSYLCTEKKVSQFCIDVDNCFEFGGIVVSQSMNTDIPNNLVCPRGV